MSGAAPADGLPPGRVLGGHYRVEERIGSGAMGVVYRVSHTLLRREFAAKVLAPSLAGDPEARARFLREAEGLVRLPHPHVVPVRHFGEEDGLLFLVMDLCPGGTLRDLLAREGPLPERRAARLALQVLQALDAAHWEGIVHRDLKPANVLLDAGDGEERALVADFGLARVGGSSALPGGGSSAPGTVAGTVAYMSPEQVRGDRDLDARSDLFSAGVLLHEMLSGRPPFEGTSSLTTALAILERPPRPLPEEGPRGVSAPVRAVIARALEKDRERRFPTATAMADALREALAGVPPGAAPAPPGRRRRALLAAGGAALLLGAAALAAGPLLRDGAPAPPPYGAARAAADRDLARRSLLDGRLEEAAAAAGRVVGAGAGTGEDLLLLACARAGLGDPRAPADLARAEALLGPDPRPRAERARFLLEERDDPAGAEAALGPPADPDARFLLVRALHARAAALPAGPEREALLPRLEAAAASIGDDPRRGVADALLALARGDPDRAQDLARRAADLHPDLAEASYALAIACRVLAAKADPSGGADRARRWFERELLAASDAAARARRRPALHGQGRDLLRFLRTACNAKYDLGDVEGAAADYANEVLGRNPSCPRDTGVGAQYLQWAGRFEEALALFERLRRAGVGDGQHHGAGFCRMQVGRRKAEAGDLAGALRELDLAVGEFTAGLARYPGTAAFRSYRAEAWLARASVLRDDAAAAALAKAREDFEALEAAGSGGDPEVLFRRWEFRRATGDGAGALADIRAAVAGGAGGAAAYRRRLAFSCIEGAAGAADGRALLEEAVGAADGAERWSPRRAELACLLRADARAALADLAPEPGKRDRLLALAREDLEKAGSLARLDPRVRAEAALRAAGLLLRAKDAAGAVREAEEALRLRRDPEAAGRTMLLANDAYLRSPLAAFHRRLGEAYAAAGRPDDAAREEASARALR